MKNLFLIFIAMTTLSVSAALPAIPKNCFNNKPYCITDAKISTPEGKGINVTIFAKIKAGGKFETIDDVVGRYTSFANWGEYAANSGTNAVKFNKSELQGTQVVDGKTVFTHFADYETKAPVIGWYRVREVSYNTLMGQTADADASVKYTMVPTSVFKPQGLDYKVGQLYIKKAVEMNEDEGVEETFFYIWSITDVVPQANLFGLAREPMIRSLESIMIGMLELNK